MSDFFRGILPQKYRKRPQSIPANEPYIEKEVIDWEFVEKQKAKRRARREKFWRFVSSWTGFLFWKIVRLFISIDFWLVVFCVGLVFGISYLIWMIGLWIVANGRIVISFLVFSFVGFVVFLMLRQLLIDRKTMPNWDDTDGQSGKEMKDNTNIEIINHIDTGNGHRTIKIINQIK